MKLRLAFILILLVQLSAFGQSRKQRVPSYFGFQYKVLFPTRFIGEPELALSGDGFESTTKQKIGYSFGGTVRVGLTKLIALETGINLNQRKFEIDMAVPDSGLYNTATLGFIEYDIPVNGLIYIQLSERWFMNASLGLSVNFKPTDVQTTFSDGYNGFIHTGVATKKVGLDLNANLGFEFRTEKSGFFYLGGSGKVPFWPLFSMVADYRYQGYSNRLFGDVDGSYLSLDLKYFFPIVNKKGTQFQKGPIE